MFVLCAGSFDPPTNGHLRVFQEARRLFPAWNLHIVVANNNAKKSLFTTEERVALLKACFPGKTEEDGIIVRSWSGLLADYMPKISKILVRGLRTVSDFEAEMTMAHINEALGLKTVFVPAGGEGVTPYVSSSIVRELLSFGALSKVQGMVPEPIFNALIEKYS